MRSEPNGIAWMIAARQPDRQRPDRQWADRQMPKRRVRESRALARATGDLVRRLDPRRLKSPTAAACCAGA